MDEEIVFEDIRLNRKFKLLDSRWNSRMLHYHIPAYFFNSDLDLLIGHLKSHRSCFNMDEITGKKRLQALSVFNGYKKWVFNKIRTEVEATLEESYKNEVEDWDNLSEEEEGMGIRRRLRGLVV